jgi:hypothetical protein
MNERLNDILNLENWSKNYLLPALYRINSKIEDFNMSNVAKLYLPYSQFQYCTKLI